MAAAIKLFPNTNQISTVARARLDHSETLSPFVASSNIYDRANEVTERYPFPVLLR